MGRGYTVLACLIGGWWWWWRRVRPQGTFSAHSKRCGEVHTLYLSRTLPAMTHCPGR